jgi:hypothetical protein
MMEDTRLISFLRERGAKQIVHDDYVQYAKPMLRENVPANVQVYNPITNTIETVSDVESLYASGAQIARITQGAEVVDGVGSSYILISKAGDLEVSVREIPYQGVLTYIPGYVSRIHKENFYIDRIGSSVIDGESVLKSSTTHSAKNSTEARALVDQLNDALTPEEIAAGVKYSYRMDRDVSEGVSRMDVEWDLHKSSGRLKTGRRGEGLTDMHGGEPEMADAIESLMRGNQVTATRVAMSDAINSLKQRLINDYADVLPKDRVTGAAIIPERGSPLVKAARYADEKVRAKEAARLVEYIRLLERSDPFNDEYKLAMASFAHMLGNVPVVGSYLENSAIWLARHNPLNIMSGLTFNTLLVTKPGRHLALGTFQHSMYAGLYPDYYASGRIYKEHLGMLTALSTIDRPLWQESAPVVGRLLGMSADDAEHYVRNLQRSGLFDIIDSHAFARDGLIEMSHSINTSVGRTMAHGAEQTIKTPFKLMQQVGFNLGEANNKVFSYLLATQRYKDKFPDAKSLVDRKAAEWIAAEAEQLSLNMTQVGKLAYQDGWLKLATQFASFQHKALLQVLPEAVGGTARFTPEEKWRMLATQLLMWGPDGLGVGDYYRVLKAHAGIELGPEALRILEEGVANYMFNGLIGAATEGDPSVDFSTFAPMGGGTQALTGIASNFITGGAIEGLMGASHHHVGWVRDTARFALYLNQRDDLGSVEKLQYHLKNIGTVVGGYNDYLKYRVAMNYGYYINRTGDPTVQALGGEALMKALFGLQSTAERDYYQIMQEMHGKFRNPESVRAAHRDIAQQLYANLTKTLVTFAPTEDMPKDRRELHRRRAEEAVQQQAMLLSALDPATAMAVKKELDKLIHTKSSVTTGADNLAEMVATMYQDGELGAGRDGFVRRVLNAFEEGRIGDKERDTLQKLFEQGLKQDAAMESYLENRQ